MTVIRLLGKTRAAGNGGILTMAIDGKLTGWVIRQLSIDGGRGRKMVG